MKQVRSFIAVALVAAACSSDPFAATAENVIGDYTARTFTTSDTAGTINWLQRGATLSISLGPNGVTVGHLFIPGAGSGGSDLDQLLLGDWTLTGNTITFDMPTVDTFVKNMSWTAGKDQLSGDHTVNGLRIKVVFIK